MITISYFVIHIVFTSQIAFWFESCTLLSLRRSRDSSYRQTSNISRTLEGNKLVVHSDIVECIARRRCSNYIFILDLTPGFNGLGKDNCKTRRGSFMFWDLVRLISEIYGNSQLTLPECQTLRCGVAGAVNMAPKLLIVIPAPRY